MSEEKGHVHRKYDPNDIRRESQDPCPDCLAREARVERLSTALTDLTEDAEEIRPLVDPFFVDDTLKSLGKSLHNARQVLSEGE